MILLGMYDIDMILGMDWLSTHHTSVDCFTKKILFWKLGYPEFKFKGDKRVLPTCLISVLETKRLPHMRCDAYLAHVVDKSSLEVTLDGVLVVQEFPDVFPKNLPCLPPNRELEFRIELLPVQFPSLYDSIGCTN